MQPFLPNLRRRFGLGSCSHKAVVRGHSLLSFPQHLSQKHMKAWVSEAMKVSGATWLFSPPISHNLFWRDYLNLRGKNAPFQMWRKHHSLLEGICIIKSPQKPEDFQKRLFSFPLVPHRPYLKEEIMKMRNKSFLYPHIRTLTVQFGQNITFGIVLKRPGSHQVQSVGHLALDGTAY